MRKFQIPIKDRLRFVELIDMSGDCWLWCNTPNKDGYGHFKVNGKTYLAHRLAFLLENDRLNDKLCVCHSCDNTMCVNPSHLWQGTNKENQQDKATKGRVSGELNPRAKVNSETMKSIFSRRKAGEPVKSLAVEFGYSRHHLYKMLRGDQWRNLHAL